MSRRFASGMLARIIHIQQRQGKVVGKQGVSFARGCTGCDLLLQTDLRERQKSGSIQTIRDVRIQCFALEPNKWARSMPEGISHDTCKRRLHMEKQVAKRFGKASHSRKDIVSRPGTATSSEEVCTIQK